VNDPARFRCASPSGGSIRSSRGLASPPVQKAFVHLPMDGEEGALDVPRRDGEVIGETRG
jgi:hypothetical protein